MISCVVSDHVGAGTGAYKYHTMQINKIKRDPLEYERKSCHLVCKVGPHCSPEKVALVSGLSSGTSSCAGG